MTDLLTPGIGDNAAPDFGRIVGDQIAADYAELANNVADMLDEARALPPAVEDDETMGVYAKLIKRLRDTTGRIEAFHSKEKAPHLRAGQAVDSFFFALWDKVARRSRTAKPGAADILQARVDEYNQRKLAAERQRREVEQRAAAAAARLAAAEAAEAERIATEARAAAERARKAQHIEAKTATAVTAETSAGARIIDAMMAADAADQAAAAARAKSADIVRTRIDEGPMVTMAQEAFAEMLDSAALDKDKLWPFISDEAKEKALRQWAKTTGHKVQMAGANIGKRDKTVIR